MNLYYVVTLKGCCLNDNVTYFDNEMPQYYVTVVVVSALAPLLFQHPQVIFGDCGINHLHNNFFNTDNVYINWTVFLFKVNKHALKLSVLTKRVVNAT